MKTPENQKITNKKISYFIPVFSYSFQKILLQTLSLLYLLFLYERWFLSMSVQIGCARAQNGFLPPYCQLRL